MLEVKSQKLQLCMRLDAAKAKDSEEGEPRKATEASGIQGWMDPKSELGFRIPHWSQLCSRVHYRYASVPISEICKTCGHFAALVPAYGMQQPQLHTAKLNLRAEFFMDLSVAGAVKNARD